MLKRFPVVLSLIAATLFAQAPPKIERRGKVLSVEYSNPKVFFSFEEAADKGPAGLKWECDTGVPPESLKQIAWKKDSLSKGQQISVTYTRDGSRISVLKLSEYRLGALHGTLVEPGRTKLRIVCTSPGQK